MLMSYGPACRRCLAAGSPLSAAIHSAHATVSGKLGELLTMKRAFWIGVNVCKGTCTGSESIASTQTYLDALSTNTRGTDTTRHLRPTTGLPKHYQGSGHPNVSYTPLLFQPTVL